MCNKLLNNEEYINYKTGETLDLSKIKLLSEKSILVAKPDLWCNWDFEKNGKLNLDIWKMTRGSDRKAWWYCNECKLSNPQVIHNKIKGTGCPVCSGKIASPNNNLSIDNPELAKQWHPTKNGKLTPHDVTPMSGKKVWWICENEHSYQSHVSDRQNGRNCAYCANKKVLLNYNNLNFTHPHITKYLINIEDGNKYTYGTFTRIKFKCDCGEILSKPINEVIKRGLSCPMCKDGVSFGEKMMFNLLKDNNIEFKYDSKTTFSMNKRYDFILEDLKCIIEIQGEHHSLERTGYFNENRTLKEEIENDILKKETAFENGICHYFTIDIYNRDITMFSENVEKSGLLKLLKINRVDWMDLALRSQKSLVLSVCEFYEKNELSTGMVSKEFKISINTVIKYLKIGNEIGIVKYSPNDEKSKILSKQALYKKVVQYSMNGKFIKIHDSVSEASNFLNKNARSTSIASCCRGELLSTLGYRWKYFSDVKNTSDLNEYKRKDNKSVVQLNVDGSLVKIFKTIKDAKEETGANNITKACKGIYKQCNGYQWMYLSDYEKLMEEQNKIS